MMDKPQTLDVADAEDKKSCSSQFDAIFDASPMGIVETDAEGRVLSWNPAAERLTGWKAHEVIGKPSPTIYPNPSDLLELVENLFNDKIVHGYRLPVKTRGGADAVHVVSAACISDEAGNLQRIVAFFEDVTERQQVDERLKLMEAALRNAYDGIVLLASGEEGSEPVIDFANKAFLDIIGFEQDEVLGQSPFGFVREDADESVLEQLRTRLPQGQAVKVESGVRRKDGATAWVESTFVPLLNGAERARHYVAVVRDVGERRDMERALRNSEARFRSLVQNTSDMISLADRSGMILYQSPSVSRVTGFAPEEMIGKAMFDFIHPDDLERITAVFLSLLEKDDAQSGLQTMRVRRKDGTWCWVEAVATNMLADVNVGSLVVNWRDVTELRNMQEQLFFSERLAALGTVSAGIAHEINNPLAYVISNLEYCMRQASDMLTAVRTGAKIEPAELEEVQMAIAEAQGGAGRVRKTVQDLRAFARPGDDENVPVDMLEVLESTLNIAWNEVRQKARLRRDYRAIPSVMADTAKLGQVLLNLIVNAAQAIPPGDVERNEISFITGVDPGGEVFLEISDTGVGIPTENQSKIFNPFFTTKPVGQGTGLGLSICHGLVNAMGGEIQARNNPERGATFRILLPQAPAERSNVASAEVATPTRISLLVIDDEPMVAKSIARLLKGNMTVRSVTSAGHALERLRNETYDLILCDLLMPTMTGMAFYERLADESPAIAAKVVFMTGGAFTPQGRSFLDALSAPYLEKPFTSSALNEFIGRALQSRS